MRSPRLPIPVIVLGLVTLCPLPGRAAADELVPKRGKAVQGAIVSQTNDEVVFNVYRSRNPGVTNPEHVLRLKMADVKRVEETPRPEVEIWRRLDVAKTADELVAAGQYARENKLKGEATLAFALALAQDPAHAEAMKGIGGRTKWDSERKGNPLLDPELAALLERYVAEPDGPARVMLQRTLKDASFAAKPYELERWRRSVLLPKGYERDRPLSYRSDVHAGAVYTIHVPAAYTPTRTWPLIIGLHGGGPDGKLGDEVVGSGPSAMNFYQRHAERHGYIVACPTALVAGWPNKQNEDFVRDLLTELKLLYHVDVDRVYLTGHSMGGFGTWGLAPRFLDDLAAVSPMAGGGGSASPYLATGTPVFIFHGADDAVVGPSGDRAVAKQFLDTTHDFVYTELDGVGHGFPDSVQQELFDFFAVRHRRDKKYKAAWPRSSFAGKVSQEEETYLGDPMAEIDGVAPDLKTWTAWLKLGGGRALAAVVALAEHQPEGAAAAVGKVLGTPAVPFTGRGYAARALGALQGEEGLAALRKAVVVEASKEQSFVAIECAQAIARRKDPEGTAALSRAVELWVGYYESHHMEPLAYSDWQRSVSVLTALCEAWADLATPESKPEVLGRSVVARVLALQHEVRVSERVPQDPAAARLALATALGRAYKGAEAPDVLWDKLLEALSNDAAAKSAAEGQRR
ncbi:MAG: dienelactone hydrolase family protein [Planctomycetota bacterium]|nr:dienelactone hydrolase family protein [Planctomycetota bacterium]